MQIDRIYAFGCSNTYGEGLPDCRTETPAGVWLAGPKPSQLAWPSLVAQHLGKTLKNLSAGGSSNTLIAHRTLSTQILPRSLVLIGWSYFDRHTIIKDSSTGWHNTPGFDFVSDPDFVMIGPWHLTNPQFHKQRKLANAYYKSFHNTTNSQLESLRLLELVDTYVKRSDSTAVHVLCEQFLTPKPHWVRSHWITTTFEDLLPKYPRALDNLHPGELAQQHMADCVTQYLAGKHGITA